MLTGAPVAPWWVAVLDAAAEWGCPPWALTGRDTPAERRRWWERWQARRHARADVMKLQQEEREQKKVRDGRAR